jgi:hypothetical protein
MKRRLQLRDAGKGKQAKKSKGTVRWRAASGTASSRAAFEKPTEKM